VTVVDCSAEVSTRDQALGRPGVALLIGILALGIALRLVSFLTGRSLGLDEVRIALNVATRSFGQLLPPLDYQQSAPPLFLWIEKALTLLFGVNDWTLRLLPLAAGLFLLLLTYGTFRRFVGPAAAVLGTAFAAVSPILVYYATGVKQYGVEALVTLVLVRLAMEVHSGSAGARPERSLLAAGAVAVWLSAPAVFVLSAVTAAFAVMALKDSASAKRVVVRGAGVWSISGTVAFLVAYRYAAQNPHMQHYWATAFLSLEDPALGLRLRALFNEAIWGMALGFPGAPGPLVPNVVLALVGAITTTLGLLGLLRVYRGQGAFALVLLAGPFVAVVFASLLGFYPVSLRLVLFLAPLAQLLIVAGVEQILEPLVPPIRRRAWILAGSIAVLPQVATSLLEVTDRNPPQHVRVLVEELQRRRQPREPVYVFVRSLLPWLYYSTNWVSPDRKRLSLMARVADPGGPAFENAPARDHPVYREGYELRYQSPAGEELYGISSGIEWTPSLGVLKLNTDVGWVENEADRIESEARPAIWVLMANVVGAEPNLLRELDRRGGLRTHVFNRRDAILMRFVFTADQPVNPSTANTD
jgi:4-amino-4-deoxy-L-arabinose transferase-like glycosyltransferase